MMLSRGMCVLQLAMSFLYVIPLRAASIVGILYTARDDASLDRATLEVGKLELHLQGTASIDYHESAIDGQRRKARFIVKNVNLSDTSCAEIEKIHNSSGLGYTLHLTAHDTKDSVTRNNNEFVVEFMYDPQLVTVAYTLGDAMNGNGTFIITLQNKKVLRALDTNHESILRLAYDAYHDESYLCC